MLLPIGSDQKTSRFPKLTVGIIVACFVIYVATYYLHQAASVLASPAAWNLEQVEGDLIIEYLRTKGESNPVGKYRSIMRNPFEAQKFQKEFREALEKGEVVSFKSTAYKKWIEARENFQRARKRDVLYLFGYVPTDPGIVSIVTYMFLHGSFWHWFFNMYFLWLVGISLEDIWGRTYFGAIFIAGGVVAALSHHLVSSASEVPLIGASGAIAALMGAYLFRFYHARLNFWFFKWEFWLPAWIPLLFWMGGDVKNAIKFWGMPTGIALWAHLGGYAFGIGAALVLKQIGAEQTFIARSVRRQDIKDKIKAKQKDEKAVANQRPPEYDEAIYARKVGEYDKAARLMKVVLDQNPADFEARDELIRIYFAMENMAEAAREMGNMIDRCLLAGAAEQAVGWYAELARRNLVNQAAGKWMFRMGQELQQRGAFDQAAVNYRTFAQAFPQDPMAPKALFITGTLLMDRLGKPDKGLAFFDHIAQVYPDWMPREVAEARQGAQRRMQGGGF